MVEPCCLILSIQDTAIGIVKSRFDVFLPFARQLLRRDQPPHGLDTGRPALHRASAWQDQSVLQCARKKAAKGQQRSGIPVQSYSAKGQILLQHGLRPCGGLWHRFQREAVNHCTECLEGTVPHIVVKIAFPMPTANTGPCWIHRRRASPARRQAASLR